MGELKHNFDGMKSDVSDSNISDHEMPDRKELMESDIDFQDDENDFANMTIADLETQHKSLEQSLHVAGEINANMTTKERVNDIQKQLQHVETEIKRRKDLEIDSEVRGSNDLVH